MKLSNTQIISNRVIQYGLIVLFAFLLINGCIKNNPSTSMVTLPDNESGQIVKTLYGEVKAEEGESDTWLWKAIPFARPPKDSLRWKAPQNPEPWEGIREKKEFCQVCPQYNYEGAVIGDEDCLYLNIWRPRSKEKKLPVYFWIHGGGNSIQTPSHAMLGASSVAAKSNMIVVTTNYRLGPFGWFAHPVLRSGKKGDEHNDSGNFGTLDQIKALEWVRGNIKAFGGDPDNIFINGESAGGANVLALLISPAAKGLFHKAMSQSGGQRSKELSIGDAAANSVITTLLQNDRIVPDEKSAKAYIKKQPKSQIADFLRSKSPQEILSCYNFGFGGMLLNFPYHFQDGTVIPLSGFKTLKTGDYPNKVPIILGSNKEEDKLFLFMNPAFQEKDELYKIVSSYSSDLWKVTAVDDVATKIVSHPDQPPVFTYQFLWGAQKSDGSSVLPDPWAFKLGACHGMDLPFFFDQDVFFGPLGRYMFTDQNRPGRKALTKAMMTYVAQFARTGNPNSADSTLIEWKPWSNVPGKAKSILFDADYNDINLKMSSTALTEEGVRADMASSVQEPLYSQALKLMRR